MDLCAIYSERAIVPVKELELPESLEERHQKIQDRITRNVYSFAHETTLPTIVREKYFKEKETIRRENLARLL